MFKYTYKKTRSRITVYIQQVVYRLYSYLLLIFFIYAEKLMLISVSLGIWFLAREQHG